MRTLDIRQLRVDITSLGTGSLCGRHSDVIDLFRMLNFMSPNLEHFEWNKKNAWKAPYEFNRWSELEYTLDILDSLPIFLKTLFAGFAFREKPSEYLHKLDERMSNFFRIFCNLKSIR